MQKITSDNFNTVHSSLEELGIEVHEIYNCVSDVASDIDRVDEVILRVDENIDRIEREGVYFKPLI